MFSMGCGMNCPKLLILLHFSPDRPPTNNSKHWVRVFSNSKQYSQHHSHMTNALTSAEWKVRHKETTWKTFACTSAMTQVGPFQSLHVAIDFSNNTFIEVQNTVEFAFCLEINIRGQDFIRNTTTSFHLWGDSFSFSCLGSLHNQTETQLKSFHLPI